jgi:hypothetical protein
MTLSVTIRGRLAEPIASMMLGSFDTLPLPICKNLGTQTRTLSCIFATFAFVNPRANAITRRATKRYEKKIPK